MFNISETEDGYRVIDQGGFSCSLERVRYLLAACEYVLANKTSEDILLENKRYCATVYPGMYEQLFGDGIEEFNPEYAQRKRIPSRQYQEPKPHVYLIEAIGIGRYKIGFSSSPEKRFNELSKQSSSPMQLVCTIEHPDARKIETALHKKFKSKRVHGEWFELSQEEVAQIKAIGGAK